MFENIFPVDSSSSFLSLAAGKASASGPEYLGFSLPRSLHARSFQEVSHHIPAGSGRRVALHPYPKNHGALTWEAGLSPREGTPPAKQRRAHGRLRLQRPRPPDADVYPEPPKFV